MIDNEYKRQLLKKYLTPINVIKLIILVLLTIFITPIGILCDIIAIRKVIKTESEQGAEAIEKIEKLLKKLLHVTTVVTIIASLAVSIIIGHKEKDIYSIINSGKTTIMPISIVRLHNDTELVLDTFLIDTNDAMLCKFNIVEKYNTIDEKYDIVYIHAFSETRDMLSNGEIFPVIKRWKKVIDRVNSTIRIACIDLIMIICVILEFALFLSRKRHK